jgi:hypothetical protein
MYAPEIKSQDVYKLVVSGTISDQSNSQTLSISQATSVNNPLKIPVTGCTVTISDDQGHLFPMTDSANGNYGVWIDPQYLVDGNSFKVEILTPDGSKIVSDYDKYSTCPEIDSVYYIRKDLATVDPDENVKGIQFYVDLDGKNTDSHYYRWDLVETWEYHSEYPIEWYYNYGIHRTYPPDYSKSICWRTSQVPNIYLLSTKNLIANKYKLSALNFVDNKNPRLVYGYSLLVKQNSLSEAAYKYWNLLRSNSTRQGGLYEKQPLAAEGNLHNITHPEQGVLGFFGASSIKSKRIFVRNVENLIMENPSSCGFHAATQNELSSLKPDYLVYVLMDTVTYVLEKGCVDCRDLYGTTVKPDFWPY